MFKVSNKTLTIPEIAKAQGCGDSKEIPSWIKNNADWWVRGFEPFEIVFCFIYPRFTSKKDNVLFQASFEASGAYLSPDGFAKAWFTSG